MQNPLIDVTLEYCAAWNYTPRAVRLTDEILSERVIEYFVGNWKLIPSSGGRFELTINGELVFSKKQLGRHAEAGEIRAAIMKVLDTLRPADFQIPEDD